MIIKADKDIIVPSEKLRSISRLLWPPSRPVSFYKKCRAYQFQQRWPGSRSANRRPFLIIYDCYQLLNYKTVKFYTGDNYTENRRSRFLDRQSERWHDMYCRMFEALLKTLLCSYFYFDYSVFVHGTLYLFKYLYWQHFVSLTG